MSLTSHIDDRRGPLREWFEDRLPNLKPLQQTYKDAGPLTLPRLGGASESGLVGAAFDYRLRYGFDRFRAADTVAAAGAVRFAMARGVGTAVIDATARPGKPRLEGGPWSKVERALDSLVDAHNPCGQFLGNDAERLLARFCCVLALYEVQFRRTGVPSPLDALEESSTVDDHLALISAEAADDVVQLYHGFAMAHSDLFGKPVELNPTFALSVALGGADGDLIVDHTMLELKVSTEPRMRREWIYQLLGYVLADTLDVHRITRCGFYFARLPAFVTWDIDYAIGVASEGSSSLQELRQSFADVVAKLGGARAAT